MIEPDSILLETISRVTPLGIRFRDVATGAVAACGLDVRIRPAGAPRRWQPVFPAGGVFAASNLPGLRFLRRGADGQPEWRDLERGPGDDAYWAGIGPDDRRAFVVEVGDRQGRFIPMTIALDLPQRGVALPACVPPERHGQAVPLYSAASRPPVPGMAAVRVELWDATRNVPASWARVELTLGGEVSTGVADRDGAALVLAPWPRIANAASGALTGAKWPVQLRAFSSGTLPREEIPDLCDVLSQPERRLSLRPDADVALGGDIRLQFGRELALKGESGKVFVRPSA